MPKKPTTSNTTDRADAKARALIDCSAAVTDRLTAFGEKCSALCIELSTSIKPPRTFAKDHQEAKLILRALTTQFNRLSLFLVEDPEPRQKKGQKKEKTKSARRERPQRDDAHDEQSPDEPEDFDQDDPG